MYSKIIVAEDFDSISIADALENFPDSNPVYSKYCDETLLKMKKAIFDGEPFELLITDLSFRSDHREENLKDGEALIEAVRKLQPDIPIVVYSMDNRPYKIKSLFNDYGINAYIVKSRISIPELKTAILDLFEGEDRILSKEVSNVLKDNVLLEIGEYDIELLKRIAKGFQQEEIANEFRNTGRTPNSTSSIEKRINKLKIYFKAQNNVHLVAITKDLGLI